MYKKQKEVYNIEFDFLQKLCIGCGESPTFTTSNSEEESKIKFYFLLRHYQLKIMKLEPLANLKNILSLMKQY